MTDWDALVGQNFKKLDALARDVEEGLAQKALSVSALIWGAGALAYNGVSAEYLLELLGSSARIAKIYREMVESEASTDDPT